MKRHTIPHRLDTLRVVRLMGRNQPILMLGQQANEYGTRWTLAGQQVEPAIASFLLEEGYIGPAGVTEFGARRLELTAAGREFREEGDRWWSNLGLLQKLKAALFG
jgi:hypothetical protein